MRATLAIMMIVTLNGSISAEESVSDVVVLGGTPMSLAVKIELLGPLAKAVEERGQRAKRA